MSEVGAGSRYLRFLVLGLAVVGLALVYNLRAYRNLATQEAMDSAQLARNIADGKGYTTLFIRPFSLYLVQSHNEAKHAAAPATTNLDFAQIKFNPHPDLANPPVYPVVLAGLMTVRSFRYPVELMKPFWSENSHFWRYQPDFQIAVFNEVLLLVVVVLTFFLARKLFDVNVAWLAALLTIGCELLWRFSVSGLSTMLLLVIFLGLTWCVLRIEEMVREPQPRPNWLLGLALASGVLTGVGALTRYAFGWTIIPVALFLFFFSGQRRVLHTLAALGAFVVVLIPWVIRNYAVSGTPFGTAGFAIVEGTAVVSAIPIGTVGASRFDARVVAQAVCDETSGECARHFGKRPAKAGRQLGEYFVPGRLAVGFSRDGRAANALFFAHVPGHVYCRPGAGADTAFE